MKRLVINLRESDRLVACTGRINKAKERKTYWFFEPLPNNTDVKFLPRARRAGFGPNGLPRGMYMTDSTGKCQHRRFRVSVCGKDQFKVMFGCQRDGSDKVQADAFEVWRRFFFSVRYMSASYLFSFAAIDQEYRKYGILPIEISPAGGKQVPHVEIIESYNQGYTNMQAITRPPSVPVAGLEARVLLVDKVFIARHKVYIKRTSRTAIQKTFRGDDFRGLVIWPRGGALSGTVTGPGLGTIDITRYLQRTGNKSMKFDPNQALRARLGQAAGRGRLSYRINVKFCKPLNGYAQASTGRIVIATRNFLNRVRSVGPRQSTMIHEMGHGLGMVPSHIQEYNEYNGNPIPSGRRRNPTHYLNGGGHCSTGASGTSPDFVEGTCVLYHIGYDTRPTAFCVSCGPIVKRLDLNPGSGDVSWPG